MTRLHTVDTRANFWPALIDMLTSLLMFFLLVYFVEHDFNAGSAELAVARQNQARFVEVLHREFAPEIAARQVADSVDLKILQIRFGEGVLFDRSEYRLKPEGRLILERLAAVFREVDASGQHLYDQIQVEGHTDDLRMDHARYPRDNWELSTARATEVMRFLTRDVSPGLDERRMSVNGYAQNRPVSAERSRNRRIELRIFFSGSADAPASGWRP